MSAALKAVARRHRKKHFFHHT